MKLHGVIILNVIPAVQIRSMEADTNYRGINWDGRGLIPEDSVRSTLVGTAAR